MGDPFRKFTARGIADAFTQRPPPSEDREVDPEDPVTLKCTCGEEIQRSPIEAGAPWVHVTESIGVLGSRIVSRTHDHKAVPDVIDIA